MGLVCLKDEKKTRACSLSLPGEDRRKPSPDTKSADTSRLDFPTSRTVRNEYLFFRAPYGILLQEAKMTKTLSDSFTFSASVNHIYQSFRAQKTQSSPYTLQIMKIRLNDSCKGIYFLARKLQN